MLCQYGPVGGVPACRLNSSWLDAPAALADLHGKIGSDALVLSRSGLVEANDPSFLTDPVGSSYLKHFLQASGLSPCVEHIPLPFCPESEPTLRYLETLASEKLSGRSDFWLVNVGVDDFDYRDWVRQRFGTRFRKADEANYSALTFCHYIAAQE